jgi:phage/plasmid-like protein (TIGR03299 family)
MAHNLATIDGKVAMAYQGETPWHKLGTVLNAGVVNVGEAMTAASLDWTVSLEPLFLRDGRQVARKAVVRDTDQSILSTVSKWYQPIQYMDAFEIFQPAIDEYGLTVEAAGALGFGERAWMLFKLPTTTAPVPGDDVNGYGVAVTGHDGKTCFEFRPTPIRVVCQNTLDAAMGGSFGRGTVKGRVFGIQHIGNVKSAIADARKIVDQVLATMEKTGETFAAMAQRAMTPAEVISYIETVFPTGKDGKVSPQLATRRRTVAELVFTGTGAALAMSATDGTPNAWACYNAVTEYFDHVAPAQTERRARTLNQSAVFGSGADLKLAALAQAARLVAA